MNNKLVLSLLLLGLGSRGFAGMIVNRASLQSILGGPGTLENFEGYAPPPGGAVFFGGVSGCIVTPAAICNGQGPGLVVPGFYVSPSGNGWQWNDAGYYGAPSREIVADGGLSIKFIVPVTAVGLDLRAFSGFSVTAAMFLVAEDDTTVIGVISDISLSSSGAPVFAGWEDAGGIGRVHLIASGQGPWSPIIDNLEFGVGSPGVPEPSSFVLLWSGVGGLIALRRRRNRLQPPLPQQAEQHRCNQEREHH